MATPRSTRLFAILARDASTAVIFRRGPSTHVLMIKWHLKTDKFEIGQWLKGRLYERRSDLSPSGELLIYFGAKYGSPLRSWTAISKPPFFTALAFWPNGSGWGGGGLFETEHSVKLDHFNSHSAVADGFSLKCGMQVTPFGPRSGFGEDGPVYHARLIRDGWTMISEGIASKPDWNAQVAFTYDTPMIFEKTTKAGHRLRMLTRGVIQKNGAWYWIDYEVLARNGDLLASLPRTEWADWHDGDLLFSQAGKLFRWSKGKIKAGLEANPNGPSLLADFSDLTFEPRIAPAWASSW